MRMFLKRYLINSPINRLAYLFLPGQESRTSMEGSRNASLVLTEVIDYA